jgi:hypothetical protein
MQPQPREKKTVVLTFRATEQQAEFLRSNRKYSAIIRNRIFNNLPNFEPPAER